MRKAAELACEFPKYRMADEGLLIFIKEALPNGSLHYKAFRKLAHFVMQNNLSKDQHNHCAMLLLVNVCFTAQKK